MVVKRVVSTAVAGLTGSENVTAKTAMSVIATLRIRELKNITKTLVTKVKFLQRTPND